MIVDGVDLSNTPHNRNIILPSVYFILGIQSQQIKIGATKNIYKRFKEIQCGNPDELRLITLIKCPDIETAFVVEKNLHNTFSKYRRKGEWFEADVVYEFIKSKRITTYLNNLEKVYMTEGD